MDLGAAQLLGPNHFSGRHFNQRRSAKESLGLVRDKDGIVRQGRMVGSSCSGGSKYHSTRRLAVKTTDGEIVEELATFVENAELLWKENASLEQS